MQTDFPTTVFYFAFAHTFCRLHVYKESAPFARKVLETVGVEFLKSKDARDWQDWDTRMLLDQVCEALPMMMAETGLTGGMGQGMVAELKIACLNKPLKR